MRADNRMASRVTAASRRRGIGLGIGVLIGLVSVGAQVMRADRVQGLFAVEEVQQRRIEQCRVLQEGEVAGVRLICSTNAPYSLSVGDSLAHSLPIRSG